jgi:phage gpG-like protein
MAPEVQVRGIRELNKALKEVESELPKAMRIGFKEIADHVVQRTRAKVPRVSGKAAGSVKPRASQKGAGIAFGGSAAPYYPWLDFGGSTGRGHKPKQSGSGAIKRPFMKEGRYVYPTIKEENEYITDAVDKLISEVVDKAGFDQRGGN